jgi:hypothetical protein
LVGNLAERWFGFVDALYLVAWQVKHNVEVPLNVVVWHFEHKAVL